MTARARRAAVGVAVVVAVLAAGCSVPLERSARALPDGAVPFGLLDEDAPPLVRPPARPTTEVDLCFVAGRMLVPVRQPVEESYTALDVVRALASPPAEPPGLTTVVADDTVVTAVDVQGGVARVDLAPLGVLGSDAQLLLVAQLVCTLTALAGIGQVAFLLDGAPVQVPRSDGSLAPGPVARDDYADMIA